MNPISKELKHEISLKVDKALENRENEALDRQKAKYAAKIDRVVKLWTDYNSALISLQNELENSHYYLRGNESEITIDTKSSYELNREEIVSMVIVQLQYSKEPDFLSLVDSLIQKEIPAQKQKVTV